MRAARFLVTVLLSASTAGHAGYAAELHVSAKGKDSGRGTEKRPFKTIQHAAERLKPGDTCVIHAGEYRETVRPANSGTADKPIRLVAAPGDTVLIRGTEPITDWKLHENMTYRAPVDWTVEQLFIDDCLMNPASYPDRGADPFHPNWIDLEAGKTEIKGATLDQPTNTWQGGTVWGMSHRLGWVTGSARIVASKPGSLTIDHTVPWWGKGKGRAVISGTAAALTVAREWYQEDGFVYFWPPGTVGPNVLGVEVTRRHWAFDLSEREHIHIEGLRVHAASVNMDKAKHCVLDGLRVRYASFRQHYRGGFNRDKGISIEAQGVGIAMSGSHNVIRNSVISRCTGDGVSIWGASNTVENCVIYDCNTSATDCAPITCTGIGHTIQSNTLFNAGRSILVRRHLVKGKILHNHMYNAGLLCRDLGMTYTYQTISKGTEIAFNRIHHNYARPPGGVGIYIDDGSKGHIIHHNLVYNTPEALSLNPPGSQKNLVFNNTMICVLAGIGMSSRKQDMTGTKVFNNIFKPHISFNLLGNPTAFYTNNIAHAKLNNFVAPENGDYRLRADSKAVDAGMEFPPYTDGFTGKAPDLGAFERGVKPWTCGSSIPEFQWGRLAPW